MNQLTIFRKVTLAVSGLVVATVFSTAVAAAIPYDGAQTNASPVPTYNVFTGVPSQGNESDFLRARVPVNGSDSDATTQYTDPLTTTCTPGQKIQMKVYVHNGASKDGNNAGSGPSVIHGAAVKVSIPAAEATSFNPAATLSGSNAATITDGVSINCNGQKVSLKYIPGSASQYSTGSGVVALSDSIVTSGVSLRSQQKPGDVWGCWNERVYVVLSVQVQAPTPPPTPTPQPKPVTATCDLFKIETSDDRTVKVSNFKYTATNATYKNTIINWDAGTGKSNDSTAAITDATQVIGQTHQYGADGTYAITATVHFSTADNPDLAAGTANCQETVTFNPNMPPVVITTVTTTTPATPETPVVVAQPTALVNTGAGSVATMFAIVSLVGTVAYRYYLSRRLV